MSIIEFYNTRITIIFYSSLIYIIYIGYIYIPIGYISMLSFIAYIYSLHKIQICYYYTHQYLLFSGNNKFVFNH